MPPAEGGGCGEEGSTRCLADGSAIERCRADGQWGVVQACGAGELCTQVEDLPAACEAQPDPEDCGERDVARCLPDGTAVERCRSDGRWGVVQVCEADQDCVDNGDGTAGCVTDQTLACGELGATRCLPDGSATERCRSDGNWAVVQVCAADQQCEMSGEGAGCVIDASLACGELGTTRCLEGGGAVERCRSNGEWQVVQWCAADQACQQPQGGQGACAAVPVEDCGARDATRCLPDGTGVERCRSDGAWGIVQTCLGDQVCDPEAEVAGCRAEAQPDCGARDATRCLPDGAGIERCRSNGRWEVVRFCGEREACQTPEGAAADCVALVDEPSYPDPTITDQASPWYERGCPLVQQAANPSALPADCRCFTNQAPRDGIPLCQRPYHLNLAGGSVGAGPSYAGVFNAEYLGGFLDAAEGAGGRLYVAVGFGASTDRRGAVLTVDLATGDRTLLSGEHPFQGTVGEGPAFGTVLDVRRGPDGNLYAYVRQRQPGEQEIVRVDPRTGDRTLVWKGRAEGFAQCSPDGSPAGALQYTDTGFALDAEGRFYLPFANPTQGRGIVRLSRALDACEVLTGNGPAEWATRGAGPALGGFVQGFTLRDGALLAFTTQPKQFVSVDLATGDRTLLLTPAGIAPPERWAVWDAGRSVWWLAGFQSAVSISAWDPATNTQASVFQGGVFPWMPLGASGPIQINALNYAPIWLLPNGNLLLGQDGFSVVEYEPSTGNSVIRSL
ncbi:MAG: hypothetical protein H6702_12470 [Myxococcales bacterium]|nr:hypothetical protein [Myxococcales bacterium]